MDAVGDGETESGWAMAFAMAFLPALDFAGQFPQRVTSWRFHLLVMFLERVDRVETDRIVQHVFIRRNENLPGSRVDD